MSPKETLKCEFIGFIIAWSAIQAGNFAGSIIIAYLFGFEKAALVFYICLISVSLLTVILVIVRLVSFGIKGLNKKMRSL